MYVVVVVVVVVEEPLDFEELDEDKVFEVEATVEVIRCFGRVRFLGRGGRDVLLDDGAAELFLLVVFPLPLVAPFEEDEAAETGPAARTELLLF